MYESLLYVNALNSRLCDAVHSAVFVCEYSLKIAIDILKSETFEIFSHGLISVEDYLYRVNLFSILG